MQLHAWGFNQIHNTVYYVTAFHLLVKECFPEKLFSEKKLWEENSRSFQLKILLTLWPSEKTNQMILKREGLMVHSFIHPFIQHVSTICQPSSTYCVMKEMQSLPSWELEFSHNILLKMLKCYTRCLKIRTLSFMKVSVQSMHCPSPRLINYIAFILLKKMCVWLCIILVYLVNSGTNFPLFKGILQEKCDFGLFFWPLAE